MHRTQANGFETIGGKTLFQDTQPLGTLAEADDFNASQEEICQAVEAAGITLNTQAQDFGIGDFNDANQLLAAILALSGRNPDQAPIIANIENGILIGDPAAPTIKTMNADPFTATALHHHNILVESGGPFDNGVVRLEEGTGEYTEREIYVTNRTTTNKQIISVSNFGGINSESITLAPGQTGHFIFIGHGGLFRWRQVRSVPNTGVFSLGLFDGNTLLASADATWEVDRQSRTISLHIPEISGVIVTGTTMKLALSGGLPSGVPDILHPDTVTTRRFPLCIVDTVAAAVKPWRWDSAFDHYLSDNAVPVGAFTVRAQTIQYSR